MRGRPRKPTNIIELEGNPGKRRINKNEPKPVAGAQCPDWLDDYAKEEWARVMPELERLGLLTFVDETAFAAYCQEYDRWRKAEEHIKKYGIMMVTKSKNIIQHPAVGVANTAISLMHKYLVEFGMTPVARTRLVNSGIDDKQDDFDRMQQLIKKRN